MTDAQAYKILGVAKGADAKGIQKAYRERALEAHPDRAGSDEERALFTRRFMKIRDAYAHLRDNGFPVPAPEEVVEDPPEVRTYHRDFAKPRYPEEERTLSETLGFKFEWNPEQVILWGIVIPGGAYGTFWFLRFIVTALRGE